MVTKEISLYTKSKIFMKKIQLPRQNVRTRKEVASLPNI